MAYRTTRKADQDIIDIYASDAADLGIEQAERYHQGLVATFELLADNPHIARERLELSLPVRLHPYQAHMIVYVVHEDGVLIVRVLHGLQDWERHL